MCAGTGGSGSGSGGGGGVPLTLALFLKTTRQLASRQFLCLAHMKKINAAIDQRAGHQGRQDQGAAGVAAGAAR